MVMRRAALGGGRWCRAGGGRLALAVLQVALLAGLGHAQCSSNTAISCGNTLSGSLSAIGEVDCFDFNGDAGETVSVTTEEVAGFFQACWRVVGTSLTSPLVCGQGQVTLPDTGTYSIQVSDFQNNQAGTYDVNLVFVSDTAGNCAEGIVCGATDARPITSIGEADTFRFVASAGETLSITAQETAGGLAACWELYDPTGLSLGTTCGQGERTAAIAGGYTIRVFDQTDMKTGTYDLNVVVVSDTTHNCAEAMACADTFARSITNVGESDTFRFDAQAAETVSITAQETAGGVSVCWDLYDPQGLQIATACGQGEKPLAVAGMYTIRVHDNDDKETGTYDVNLTFVSDTASNCAEPIGCGQNLSRSLGDVGQSNTYRFTSAAGETVSVTAQETSAFLSACWELYDPDGISVVGACGQAEKTLAVAGDYTIRVFDTGDAETGTYNIDVTVVSDTASNCAEPITCGQTLARSIATPGESDTYRFDAVAGEVVSVTAQETGGFLSACWEIYDPEGISLGGICGQAEKTLAVAGGYTIRVSDNDDTETGTYDTNVVVVSDTAHNCAQPIACGDVLSGTLGLRGESDTFRVDGAQVAGDVTIDTQETGGLVNACWELYDPTGASLSGVCGSSVKTLAFAGNYTVRVYDQGDNDTGSYDVTLCTPTTTTTTTAPGGTTTTTIPLPGGGERISGKTLLLRDAAGKPAKRRLLAVSKDPTISLGRGALSVDDPQAAGATLRVLTTAGDAFDSTYVLPSTGWRPLSRRNPAKGWKFTGGDPVKLVIVRAGKLVRIVGRGASLGSSLAANPDPVGVVLTLGTHPDCMQFGGTVQFTAGKKFLAKNAPAPAVCPGTP